MKKKPKRQGMGWQDNKRAAASLRRLGILPPAKESKSRFGKA